MLSLVHSDIFRSTMQTLTNPVNCVGVMGAGLALQFKTRFPSMYVEYTEQCRRGVLVPGMPYLHRGERWVLNFPTKRHWKDLSLATDIVTGLEYLVQHYVEWGIKSLAVPPLGCGLGGLAWPEIGPVLVRYLEKMDIPVELYTP